MNKERKMKITKQNRYFSKKYSSEKKYLMRNTLHILSSRFLLYGF